MLILPPVDSGTTTLANFERGVYEPSTEARDGARVFDGSEEEEDVEGSRLPLLIVLALLVLAMFAGVVWLAYTQGVARGRGETPVLTAANGPERVAPQDGGGNVPYQGFKIYEQPAPPDDSAEAPAAAAAKPAPVAVTPAPPPPVVKAEAPPAPKPAPAKIEPAPVKPAPAKTETPPKSVAALIQQANSEPVKPAPAPKAPPPAAKPAPAPAQATGAPRSLTPPQQVAANAPATLAAPAAAASGTYMLQIGAFKSQAEAAAAWKTYQGKHAALLSGYSDNVQQADLGEKGTWYRLRIGGFADKEVATALCDRLKADGGACMLGR